MELFLIIRVTPYCHGLSNFSFFSTFLCDFVNSKAFKLFLPKFVASILSTQQLSIGEIAYSEEVLGRLKWLDEIEEAIYIVSSMLELIISSIHVLPSQLPLPILLT